MNRTSIAVTAFWPAVLAVACGLSACAAPVHSQPLSPVLGIGVREWKVPWTIAPAGGAPWADEYGSIWVVGETEDYVARFDSTTKTFRRFVLPRGFQPQSVGGRGATLYVTGRGRNEILSLMPATDSIRAYQIPGSKTPEPHAMLFDDKSNAAWFTASVSGAIGRFDAATGGFLVWRLAGAPEPKSVTLDARGRPWFTLTGSGRLTVVDPAAQESREFVLPANAQPWRLAASSDSAIWYTDHRRGKIGRLDAQTKNVEEFDLPEGPNSQPSSLTIDPRNVLWIAQDGTAANRVLAFDAVKRRWLGAVVIGRVSTVGITDLIYQRTTNSVWYMRAGGILGQITLANSELVSGAPANQTIRKIKESEKHQGRPQRDYESSMRRSLTRDRMTLARGSPPQREIAQVRIRD